MNKIFPILTVAALAGFASTTNSQAELIIYEGFDYAGPTLSDSDGLGTDANGGTGFNSAWNNGRTDPIVAGLTDARSKGAGGGIGNAVNTSLNSLGRTYDGTAYGDDGDVTWFSLIFTTPLVPTTGTRMQLFSSGPNMASGNGFGFETTNATTLTARIGGNNSTSTFTITGGTQYFAIGKFTNSTAGNDLLDIWIDPSAAEIEAGLIITPSTTHSLASANITFSASSGVYLRANANNANSVWKADELYVGTTLADVAIVPEVSNLLVGGLLGLGLLRRRRAE